jgi:hypothetical protein
VGTVLINVIVTAAVVGFASWLSGRSPGTAGFIVALPLATMLVLPLSQLQHGEGANTMLFAKSIFVALPMTLIFFIPFLVSGKLGLSFWQSYALGCFALVPGYLAHRIVVRTFWQVGG